MIRTENVKTYGWEAAIRGARNPMNSWHLTDSEYDVDWIDDSVWPHVEGHDVVILGDNDRKLLTNLANAGPDHGKFMRMIAVTMDITAPLYWWKEFDTYKVGTVANSCSTMHKIHANEFTRADFSIEHLWDLPTLDADEDDPDSIGYTNEVEILDMVIERLNYLRDYFNLTKNKVFWYRMIQLLPSSYNQRRTVLLNYQVLKAMYHARHFHKLDEWREFCRWIETLPYSELITGVVADA